MPWEPSDATKHTKKAKTDKQKKAWAAAANSALAKCLDDGGTTKTCEARAIRIANSTLEEQEMTLLQKEIEQPVDDQQTDDPNLQEYQGWMVPDHYSWSATSFSDLDKEIEAQEQVADLQERMAQLWMLMHNTLNDPEIDDKGTALSALFGEFLQVVGLSLSDGDMEETGNVLSLSERDQAELEELAVTAENPRRLPVLVDFVIVKPGMGNTRDNRYYSPQLLERDGSVFEGVDVYATNHKETEKSERTKVGKVRSVVGLSEHGLVGQFLIYDPDMAEKTRNRADAGELSSLHCSIYASGLGRMGEHAGRKAFIVEEITDASSVDLVSKAGAGGHALSLSEMEGDPTMNDKDQKETITEGEQEKVPIEEQETEAPEAEATQDDEAPEAEAPETDADPAPESETEPDSAETTEAAPEFTPDQVQDVLDESDLSPDAKSFLVRSSYASREELDQAIREMTEFVTSLQTGAGRPFALGESEPETPKQVTAAEREKNARDRFKAIMAEVDPTYSQRL